MQSNNEDLQGEMLQLRAENEYLRTQGSSTKPPVDIMGSICSSGSSVKRETFGVKPTRKTVGQMAPIKKIQLNTRKTITM